MKIWDVETGEYECLGTLRGHTKGVKNVVWSPDGEKITSGSYDSLVKIWDVETGEYECLGTLRGHTKGVKSVVWSPDGERIASGSYDSLVKIWDVSVSISIPYFNKFQFVD